MSKVRISEVAKELGMDAKSVISKAKEMGLDVKAANSAVSIEEAGYLMDFILTGKNNSPSAKKDSGVSDAKSDDKKVKETKEEPKKVEESKPVQKEKKEISKDRVKNEPVDEKTAQKSELSDKKEKVIKKEVETTKEPLAPTALKKRRGLMIVKKKKPAPQAKNETSQNKYTMPDIAEGAIKKKKKVKKTPTARQDDSQKIDIFGSGDINAIDIMDESEMVVLHDLNFNIKDEEEDKGQTKKKFDPTKMRSTKQSSFIKQRGISRKTTKRKRKRVEDKDQEIKHVEIPEEVRVYEFAEKIGKQTSDIIKVLFTLGLMVTKNDFLDKDAIEILAEEFDIEVTTINPLDEFDYEKEYEVVADEDELEVKPPVITIMGHVDHGKTSLLDKIRETKVASGEHGGITQHVGAYMIEKNGQKITFIDTPGHEAFTEMRSRGAQATDIVVIVVAADDGVKPQTKEAIEHAKAANVPFIIAINKIDKPDANPDLAKSGLAELGITPVDWGGEHEFINVSAHTGEGIDELLETLLLQAELLELKANPKAKAKSIVVETSLEKGRGAVATVIMQNGTLRVGDVVVCGIAYGKVRAILNEDSKQLKELKPGEPGVIVGLNTVPNAGDILMSMNSDKEAREYANKRAEYLRQKELSKTTKVTLDDLSAKIAEGQIKNLPVILKSDVAGTLEALKSSLSKLRNDEVKVNIISSGVGGITESDIALAEASENAVILGFNVRPTGSVKEKAKKAGVSVNTYNVIYDLIDDVKDLLGGLLSPIIREENLGQAEVKEVFNVPKLGQVAGCVVTDGVINRGAKVRVIREGVVIYEGEISSLKRFKDDVREVNKGYECGIGVVGYNDIKVGDFLESFKEVEEKATL